jgi:hypothetical protein
MRIKRSAAVVRGASVSCAPGARGPQGEVGAAARPRRAPRSTRISDGDGAAIRPRACALGLEGIVSKRRDSRYVAGRTRLWLKAKNPGSDAARREATEDWGRRKYTSA